jgi:hypothetical protein
VDLLYRAPLNGSSFDVPSLSRVSGQCAWQAVPRDSWIRVAPSSGGDGDLFRLTVEELVQIPSVPAGQSYLRQGTIVISWPGAQTPLTVTVVQDGCSYVRSQNVSAAAAGGVVGYYGASHGGCNFTATTDVPWLSAVRNAITYVSLLAEPNTSMVPRTGTLTIGWSGGESHIVVVQAGAPASSAVR